MRTRIGWASAVAVLGLALTLAFAGVQGAMAVQGQAVIAGQVNTETDETVVQNTSVNVSGCTQGVVSGLLACGTRGLEGYGTSYGVYAQADHIGTFASGHDYGVDAVGNVGVRGEGDIGVQGMVASSTGLAGIEGQALAAGNGVWGHTDGSGSGVYGETSGTGYGVLGYSPSATAVRAQTAGGIAVLATAGAGGKALKVTGKAQFSRSGLAVVSAGTASVTVNNVALTSRSVVLATVQDQTAVGVKAVVRDLIGHSFRIVLTKAATFNTSVGWFIVETP